MQPFHDIHDNECSQCHSDHIATVIDPVHGMALHCRNCGHTQPYPDLDHLVAKLTAKDDE